MNGEPIGRPPGMSYEDWIAQCVAEAPPIPPEVMERIARLMPPVPPANNQNGDYEREA